MNMQVLLNEKVDPKTLMEFERNYKKEKAMGHVTDNTKFEYAWALVRSAYSDDWKSGCKLLEELYNEGDNQAKRDYLFYMATAEYKLKHYDIALDYCKTILQLEPHNNQVMQLKSFIEKQMQKEGLFGMAVAGAASFVVGVGAVALATLLLSQRK